jgi:hypothetical protein
MRLAHQALFLGPPPGSLCRAEPLVAFRAALRDRDQIRLTAAACLILMARLRAWCVRTWRHRFWIDAI